MNSHRKQWFYRLTYRVAMTSAITFALYMPFAAGVKVLDIMGRL